MTERGLPNQEYTAAGAYVGRGDKQVRLDAAALARYAQRSGSRNVEDLAIWTRGRMHALSANDIAVITVRRDRET